MNFDFGGKLSMTNQQKKLRRSRSDRVVAGVCGGLAEFFGISAFWFRLAFLIALIPGGVPGLLPYIILWLIMPKEK
jgi:phage shock protein C